MKSHYKNSLKIWVVLAAMACSSEPSPEELRAVEESQVQIVDYQTEEKQNGVEHRYEESPIVFKKMNRLSSKSQTLSLLESQKKFHIVCESFDELREDVRCRVESTALIPSEELQWKIQSSDEHETIEIEHIGDEIWQVLIASSSDWLLKAEHKQSSQTAEFKRGQAVCHSDLIEHVGGDGINRCLQAKSRANTVQEKFSHLRLINMQAESQQALMLSTGEEILGRQGDRISLSIYTEGVEKREGIKAYGIPVLGAGGKEVMRVCVAAEDLELPGWLGAQFRLAGSQYLKVGRPIAANHHECRGEFSNGLLVWYIAHIL